MAGGVSTVFFSTSFWLSDGAAWLVVAGIVKDEIIFIDLVLLAAVEFDVTVLTPGLEAACWLSLPWMILRVLATKFYKLQI